jgi:hypothetical protein
VVNAYLIAFGGPLLLAGRLGDLVGQRRFHRADDEWSGRPRFKPSLPASTDARNWQNN